MSKIKVKISETKFLSFFKSLVWALKIMKTGLILCCKIFASQSSLAPSEPLKEAVEESTAPSEPQEDAKEEL